MMNEEFCIQLASAQYYLNCWSVSGLESCVTVRINQKSFAFDIGHTTRSSINCEHVFITHGHVDHCGALAKHVSQRDMRSMPPATYYCPAQIEENLKQICQSYALMAERYVFVCVCLYLVAQKNPRMQPSRQCEVYRLIDWLID
jgi:Metallo-beta-lactamase superfamily